VPCGEKPGSYPLLNGAVRSLQSGLPANYREKWASFAYFGGKNAGISLQLGLAGGAHSLELTLLRRIPANREKYRGFVRFLLSKMHASFSKLHVLLGKDSRSTFYAGFSG
jgi:hypothetical protein